ncbi:hypothetical protein RHMOL_Rhmol02G0185000 [Rhododendron molle]|uniref:Uncharacterized protein n=1 Tax=Rhododendron molle TaxID=49168 RepID=A0ACC0PUD5_RHOML|nr:hypothetical protein RHMOL_Rhmol02G0185000 [Rhododendron molle]
MQRTSPSAKGDPNDSPCWLGKLNNIRIADNMVAVAAATKQAWLEKVPIVLFLLEKSLEEVPMMIERSDHISYLGIRMWDAKIMCRSSALDNPAGVFADY